MILKPIIIDLLLNISVITIGFSMITNGITVANLIRNEISKINEEVDEKTKKKVLLPPDLKKASELKPNETIKFNLCLFKTAVIFFFIIIIMVSCEPRARESFTVDITNCNVILPKDQLLDGYHFWYFLLLTFFSWIETLVLFLSLFSSVRLTCQYLEISSINHGKQPLSCLMLFISHFKNAIYKTLEE